MFDWFKSEQREQRRKIKLDRNHLEARARRFLEKFMRADATGKPQFYRAVEDASQQCQPRETGLPTSELSDALIAEATSKAAMKMVLAREKRLAKNKDDRVADLFTDAFATVGIAYHRAAGIYARDKDLQDLGTAAVHLLTMATSYTTAQKE